MIERLNFATAAQVVGGVAALAGLYLWLGLALSLLIGGGVVFVLAVAYEMFAPERPAGGRPTEVDGVQLRSRGA